ncbi:acetyl esterase/lipase [Filibacter limicola]|uniref:Acetyl esterase/lipase n=2 Tax=Sporosarcina limicola TaxID=34101 RepID=A0A927RG74_9BACL|nr:acetyl esterase/lipase [Sporosarcina limicola]
MDHVYFAGDSAGAQIVSQFVTIQVEKSYADLLGIKAIVPPESIEGTLLFCGPYDVTRFAEISDNFLVSFLFRRMGWAYMGDKNWLDSDSAKEASIIEYVSSTFPHTFITDGNTGSFENQGMELTKSLKANGVPVKDIFYPKQEEKLGHEYQFIMNTPQAENTFNEMIKFLKSSTEK